MSIIEVSTAVGMARYTKAVVHTIFACGSHRSRHIQNNTRYYELVPLFLHHANYMAQVLQQNTIPLTNICTKRDRFYYPSVHIFYYIILH